MTDMSFNTDGHLFAQGMKGRENRPISNMKEVDKMVFNTMLHKCNCGWYSILL